MPKKGSSKTSSTAKQTEITETALPLLNKPLDHVGKAINFPGDFWEGRMSAEEKATLYKCVMRDYSALHKWAGGRAPCAAVELQEMGVQGTGSLEDALELMFSRSQRTCACSELMSSRLYVCAASKSRVVPLERTRCALHFDVYVCAERPDIFKFTLFSMGIRHFCCAGLVPSIHE